MRRPAHLSIARLLRATLALVALASLSFARAEAAPSGPALNLEIRDSADYWRNLRGGLRVGNTSLNKLQVSASFEGDAAGLPGLRAYAQIFKTNAESFSGSRTGDTQTVSNIEAQKVTRLFELWVSQAFGDESRAGWFAGQVGLIDLNRTFDSIAPAALFLNASHGIGPDLSHSGVSGPSIFPVSGPAAQLGWRPARSLAIHLGAFAEPDRTDRLADLKIANGAILISQADWSFARDAQASVAVWRYTVRQVSVAAPARSLRPRPGVYGFVQGPAPLPGRPSGWVRAGLADGRVQDVSGYLGGGLVWTGSGRRADDQFGLAVGHAVIGRPTRHAQGLAAGETTLEASYSFAVGRALRLQPDVQQIFHPSGQPGLRDATAIGLRVTGVWKAPGGGND